MIDNYKDLTLGKFLEIDSILSSEGEEIDKQIAIVAILSNQREEDIMALSLPDYAALSAKTAFLRTDCPPVSAPSRLICGDFVLIPTTDFTKITTAQYVDFQTFSKGGVKMLAHVLSVFLVPEGKKYNAGYDVAAVRKAVEDTPFPVALGMCAFFLDAYLKSMQASLSSLDGAFLKMKDKEKAMKVRERVRSIREQIHGLGLQM